MPSRCAGAKRTARTIDPPINQKLNDEAHRNLSAAWPVFEKATVEEAWAGMIDITPDSNPVIDAVPGVPGLTLAAIGFQTILNSFFASILGMARR